MSGSNRPVEGTPRQESHEDESDSTSQPNEPPVQELSDEQATGTLLTPRQQFFLPLLTASHLMSRTRLPRQSEGVRNYARRSSRLVQTCRTSEMIPSLDEPQVIQDSQEAVEHGHAAVTRPMATNTSTMHFTDPDAGRLMLYEETTTVYSEISVVEALEDENISHLLINLLYYESLPVLDRTIQFLCRNAPWHLMKIIFIRRERNRELLDDARGASQPHLVSLSHEVPVQAPPLASGLPAPAAEVVNQPSSSSSSAVYDSSIPQLVLQEDQPSVVRPHINLFDPPPASISGLPAPVAEVVHQPSSSAVHNSSIPQLVPLDQPLVVRPRINLFDPLPIFEYSDDDGYASSSSSAATVFSRRRSSLAVLIDERAQVSEPSSFVAVPPRTTEPDIEPSSPPGSSASIPSSLSFTSEEAQITSTESSGPSHPDETSKNERTSEMVPLSVRMWQTYPTQHELLEGAGDDVTSLDELLAKQNEAGLAEAQGGLQGQGMSDPLELQPESADLVRQENSTQTRVIAQYTPHPLPESAAYDQSSVLAAHYSRTDPQASLFPMPRTVSIKPPDVKPEGKVTLHYSPDDGGREDPAYLYDTAVYVPPTTSVLEGTSQSQLELLPQQSEDAGERSIVIRPNQRSVPAVYRTLLDSTTLPSRLLHKIQAWQNASMSSNLQPFSLRSTNEQLQQMADIITQDIHRHCITGVLAAYTRARASTGLRVLQEPSASSVAVQATHLPDPSVTLIQSHSSPAILPSYQLPVIEEVFENSSIVGDSIRHGEQETVFVPQSFPVGSNEPTESVSQRRPLSTNEIEVVFQRVNYDDTHEELETAQPEEASSVSAFPTDNNRAMMQSTGTSSDIPFPVELFYPFRSVSKEVHSCSVFVTPSDIDAQSGGTYIVSTEEEKDLPDKISISTIEIIPRRQSITINDEELFAVGESSGMTSVRGAGVRHMSLLGEEAAGFDQGVGTNLSQRASHTSSVDEGTDEHTLIRQTCQTVAEVEQLDRPCLESPVTSELLDEMQDVGGEKSESSEEDEAAGHDQGVDTNKKLFRARRKLLQSMAEFIIFKDTEVPTVKHSRSPHEAQEVTDCVTSNDPLLINVDPAGSTGVYPHIDILQPLVEKNVFLIEESRSDAVAGFVGGSLKDNCVLVFIQDHNDSIVVYLHDRLRAIVVLNNTEVGQRTISTINDVCVIKFLRLNIKIIIQSFKERISGLREFIGYVREMMMLHPYSVEELNFHHCGDHNTNLPISVMDSAALLMGSLIESSCICLTSDASTIIYPTLDKNINFTKAGVQTIMEGESVMINLTDTESDSLGGVLSSTIQQILDRFSQSIRLRQAVSSLIHTAACLISSQPICLTVKCTTDGRRLIMITKENPYVPPLNETPIVESREELQAEGRAQEEGHPVAHSAIESEVSLLPRSMLEKEEPETYQGSSQITEPPGPCTKQPHVEQSSKHVAKSEELSRPKATVKRQLPVKRQLHFEGLPLPPQKPYELQQSTSLQPQPSTFEPQPSTSFEPQPSTFFEPQPSTSFEPQPSTSFAPQPSTSFQPEHDIQDINILSVEHHRRSQMSSYTSDIYSSRPRSPQKHARRPPLSRQHYDQPEECLYGAQAASYDTESDTYEIIGIDNIFDENSIAGYIIPQCDQLGGMFLRSVHKTMIFFHYNDGFTSLFLSSEGTGIIIHEDMAKHKRIMSKLDNIEMHNFLKEEILNITGASRGPVSVIQSFIISIYEIQQQMPHVVEPTTSHSSGNQASGLLRTPFQEEFITEAQTALQFLVSIGNHTLDSQEQGRGTVAESIHTDFTVQGQLLRSKYNRVMIRNRLENLVSALLYAQDSLGSTQQVEVPQSEAASIATASQSKSLESQPVTKTSVPSCDQPTHFLHGKPSPVRLDKSTVRRTEHEHRSERVESCELIQIVRPLHTVDNTTGYFVSHDESLVGVYTCSNYYAQLCFQDVEGITSLYVSTDEDAIIIHETTDKQHRLIAPVRESNLRVILLSNITNLACMSSGSVEGLSGLASSINDLFLQIPHVIEEQELPRRRLVEEISGHCVRRSLSMDYVIGTAFSVTENMVETVNMAFDKNRQVHSLYGAESLETIREQSSLEHAPELTESPFRRRIEEFILHLEDLMGRMVVQQPLRAPLPRPTSELRSIQESLPRSRLESFPRSSRLTSLQRFDLQDQADQVSGKLVKTLPETAEHEYKVPSTNKPSVQTGSEVLVSIRGNVGQDTFEVEITDMSSVCEQVSDGLGTGEAVQIYDETTADISPVSLRQTGSVEVFQIIIPDLPEAVTGYFMSLDQNLIGIFCHQSNGYSEFVFKDQAGSTSLYLHCEKPSVILHETEETHERIASLIDDQDLKINLMNHISDVTASIGSTVSGLSRLTQAIRDELNILPRIDDEQVTEICDLFQQPIEFLDEAVSTVPLSIQNLIKAKSRMLYSPRPLACSTPEYHTTLQQSQDEFEMCEDLLSHGEDMISTEIISINVSLEPEDYAGYFVLEDGQTVGIFYLFKESRILFINDEIGGTVLYLPDCQSGIIVHEIAESHQRKMCNLCDEEVCISLINELSKLLTTSGGYITGIRSLILNIRNLLSFTIQERQAKEQISKHQSECSPDEQELVNHAAAALESLLKLIKLALSPRESQMGDVAETVEESLASSHFETSETVIRSEHISYVQTAVSVLLDLRAKILNLQNLYSGGEHEPPPASELRLLKSISTLTSQTTPTSELPRAESVSESPVRAPSSPEIQSVALYEVLSSLAQTDSPTSQPVSQPDTGNVTESTFVPFQPEMHDSGSVCTTRKQGEVNEEYSGVSVSQDTSTKTVADKSPESLPMEPEMKHLVVSNIKDTDKEKEKEVPQDTSSRETEADQAVQNVPKEPQLEKIKSKPQRKRYKKLKFSEKEEMKESESVSQDTRTKTVADKSESLPMEPEIKHLVVSDLKDTDKENEKQVPQDTSSREKEADQPGQNEPQESQLEQIVSKAKPQRQRYKKLRFSEKEEMKESESVTQSTEEFSGVSLSQDTSTKTVADKSESLPMEPEMKQLVVLDIKGTDKEKEKEVPEDTSSCEKEADESVQNVSQLEQTLSKPQRQRYKKLRFSEKEEMKGSESVTQSTEVVDSSSSSNLTASLDSKPGCSTSSIYQDAEESQSHTSVYEDVSSDPVSTTLPDQPGTTQQELFTKESIVKEASVTSVVPQHQAVEESSTRKSDQPEKIFSEKKTKSAGSKKKGAIRKEKTQIEPQGKAFEKSTREKATQHLSYKVLQKETTLEKSTVDKPKDPVTPAELQPQGVVPTEKQGAIKKTKEKPTPAAPKQQHESVLWETSKPVEFIEVQPIVDETVIREIIPGVRLRLSEDFEMNFYVAPPPIEVPKQDYIPEELRQPVRSLCHNFRPSFKERNWSVHCSIDRARHRWYAPLMRLSLPCDICGQTVKPKIRRFECASCRIVSHEQCIHHTPYCEGDEDVTLRMYKTPESDCLCGYLLMEGSNGVIEFVFVAMEAKKITFYRVDETTPSMTPFGPSDLNFQDCEVFFIPSDCNYSFQMSVHVDEVCKSTVTFRAQSPMNRYFWVLALFDAITPPISNLSALISARKQMLKLLYEDCFKIALDVHLHVNDVIFLRQSQLLLCCEEGMFFYEMDRGQLTRLLEGFTRVQRFFFTYDSRYSSYLLAKIFNEVSLVKISNEDVFQQISFFTESPTTRFTRGEEQLSVRFEMIQRNVGGAVMNESNTFLGYYSGHSVILTELEGNYGGILSDRDVQSYFNDPVQYLTFLDDKTVLVYAGNFYILQLNRGRAFMPLMSRSAALQEIQNIINQKPNPYIGVFPVIGGTEMNFFICVGQYAFKVALRVDGFVTQRYCIPGMISAELFRGSTLRILQEDGIAYYDLNLIRSDDKSKFLILNEDSRSLVQIIHFPRPRLVRAQHGVQPEIEFVIGSDEDFDLIGILNNEMVLDRLTLLLIQSEFILGKDCFEHTELYKIIREGGDEEALDSDVQSSSETSEVSEQESLYESAGTSQSGPIRLSGIAEVSSHIRNLQEFEENERMCHSNISRLERAQRNISLYGKTRTPLVYKIETLYRRNLHYLKQINALREKITMDPRCAAYTFPIFLPPEHQC